MEIFLPPLEKVIETPKHLDLLLQRPEFVDYWTYKWSDLLLVSSKQLKPTAMWSYYNWVRKNVAANTPWDRFVHELITAQGSALEPLTKDKAYVRHSSFLNRAWAGLDSNQLSRVRAWSTENLKKTQKRPGIEWN